MTTNELIKILQEEDPEGNCHVRICGEAPWFAEKKEGYWDGPYTYIEDDETFVFSTKGYKIDLRVIEPDTWIEKFPETWRDKIRFEYSYLDDSREKEMMKTLEGYSKDYHSLENRLNDGATVKMINKIKKGWRIFHDKDKPIKQYHRMYWKKGLRTDRLNQGECGILLNSELFYHDDGEWKFDIMKGKKYL